MNQNFLWGAAISANQCEGAWNINGKGPSIADMLTQGSQNETRKVTDVIDKKAYYPSHDGVEFFENYKQDIKLFSELGLRAFRFSINWSRIFPTGLESTPDEKGLQFYDNLLDELLKYHIEPIVTLSHFEMPYGLIQKYNGWSSRKTVTCFMRYVETIFDRYSDKVKYWLTFNEINNAFTPAGPILSLGTVKDLSGSILEIGKKTDIQTKINSLHHELLASAESVILAHHKYPHFKIGSMTAFIPYYPYTARTSDVIEAQKQTNLLDWYTSDVQVRGEYSYFAHKLWQENNIKIDMKENDQVVLKQGKVDFYALSYYMSMCAGRTRNKESVAGNFIQGLKNPYLKTSEWGWQLDPEGLRYSLNEIYSRYKIPIMIVENGLGAKDHVSKDGKVHDPYRITYLQKHIQAMKESINDGVNVIGYMLWSALDLVSASTGEMRKRYGLVYVNKQDNGSGDFRRIKKDSFYWYQKVIKTNGERLEANN